MSINHAAIYDAIIKTHQLPRYRQRGSTANTIYLCKNTNSVMVCAHQNQAESIRKQHGIRTTTWGALATMGVCEGSEEKYVWDPCAVVQAVATAAAAAAEELRITEELLNAIMYVLTKDVS